jgi:hypothetical protein
MTTTQEILRLAASGSPWKRACRACATSNVTTATIGLGVVDTVQLAKGDRVLLTAQTTATENGIWVASPAGWWRAEDWGADTFAQLGTSVVVLEGTNAGVWTMTSPTTGDSYGAIEIGTDEPVFEVTSFLSHGDLPGGTLHAAATTDTAGFMSAADKTKLDNATDQATASRLVMRDSDGRSEFNGVTANGIWPEDAAEAVATLPLQARGARCHVNDIGIRPFANLVHDAGIAAQSTNGEAGGMNFRYGDARAGHPEAEYIAAEITHVGTPGARTPDYWRLHTDSNPTTGDTISMFLRATNKMLVEAGEGLMQFTMGAARIIRRSWTKAAPSVTDAGDGVSGWTSEVQRSVKTSGVETRTIFDSDTMDASSERPQSTSWNWCDVTIICHQLGGTRECYRFEFGWLGGYGDLSGPHAYSWSTALAGRVALSNDGSGRQKINVTGLSGQDLIWTMSMRIRHEDHTL